MDSSQWAHEGSGIVNSMGEIKMMRPNKDQIFSCPRCHSTNTKFCYYNNYSLNQPRYLCKTCKRYWTQGGSLRNVPIGGGSRKNKKSNSSQVQRRQNYVVSQFLEIPKIENNVSIDHNQHSAQISALGMNMMMHGNRDTSIPCFQTGEFCFQELKPAFGFGSQENGGRVMLSFEHLYKQISRASEGDQNNGQGNSGGCWNVM